MNSISIEIMVIIEVDEKNIFDAARIHSISWQESHRSFCESEFVELHTPEHQREYLLEKLKIGYRYIGLNIESECLYGDAGLG